MPRLLVISDTHGYLDAAKAAIVERGPWDHVVHLGDSALDAVDLALDLGVDVVAVRGNNEFPGAGDPGDVLVFELGQVKFYAIHGHELDLNPYNEGMEESLHELARRAKEAGCKAALFGHTHIPLKREMDGVLLVNPGGMGMGDQKRTCAEISADRGMVEALIEEV